MVDIGMGEEGWVWWGVRDERGEYMEGVEGRVGVGE